MKKNIERSPLPGELPSHFADRLGVYYSPLHSVERKKGLGQYFTPLSVAHFMATYYSLSINDESILKILDPGGGTGILSCALIERIVQSHKHPKKISLTIYEIDSDLSKYTSQVLNYLKSWLQNEYDVQLIYTLYNCDFIYAYADTLENQNRIDEEYDIIISNPPYFKIQKTDGRVKANDTIVHGQPNIYAMFLHTAASLLKEGGQLIFITPRSFSSGLYFRLFRERFFSLVELESVHLFESRKDAFKRDAVLQENIIISARRIKSNVSTSQVTISTSQGISDIENKTVEQYPLDEIFDRTSYQKILHLPASRDEAEVVKLFKSWKGNLNAYNIQISTGPVVSYRARQFIFASQQPDMILAPLYLLYNTSKMKWEWPVSKKNKEQYIQVSDDTKSLLIPNKNYIFLRRFSSKDDHSRLIATPYFADNVESNVIGVENHLNYIYRPHGHLDRREILGLSALLNSSLFDTYFRTFNGNINVSATELREMPLPDISLIMELGNKLILENNFTQTVVDEILRQFFKSREELRVA